MAIVDFSVVPIGTGSTSLSDAVALAHKVVIDSGLPNRLNPMTTTIEGDLAQIFRIIEKVHDKLKEAGYMRLSTKMTIDDRFDREGPRMESKIRSVEAKIAEM